MIKKLHIPGGESDGKEWDDWAGKPGALLLAPCWPHLAWEYPHVSCRKDGKCWGSQGNSRIKRLIWEEQMAGIEDSKNGYQDMTWEVYMGPATLQWLPVKYADQTSHTIVKTSKPQGDTYRRNPVICIIDFLGRKRQHSGTWEFTQRDQTIQNICFILAPLGNWTVNNLIQEIV